MTPTDFSFALARLGWNQATFAVYAGYSPKTVSHWVTGKGPVPLIVENHLDLLVAFRERMPD